MNHEIHHLAKLLRSFFSLPELRDFVGSVDTGQDLRVYLPSSATSLAEACTETALLLERWGMSDAELFAKLHQHRPTRLSEIIAYHRMRAPAPTTIMRRTKSLEMKASILEKPVGVYKLQLGQVKFVGRSGEAEIQFPGDLVKLSRLHAWVSWPPSGPTVQDLNSKNGTWINGRRVQRASLRQDDEMQLGEITLVIHDPDRTETVGPTPSDTRS